MTKRSILLLGVCILFFTVLSCGNENGNFIIEKGRVGNIDTETTIMELEKIFKKDSIVKNLSEGAKGDVYLQDDDEYLIFEKGGKHLLTIVPKQPLDSTSTIKSIEIHDSRFRTVSGITTESTFSQVNTNNTINDVESTFSSATLFIDDLNTTLVISKKDIGFKGQNTHKVSLDQIPDLAKIRSFVVWFN